MAIDQTQIASLDPEYPIRWFMVAFLPVSECALRGALGRTWKGRLGERPIIPLQCFNEVSLARIWLVSLCRILRHSIMGLFCQARIVSVSNLMFILRIIQIYLLL